MGLTALAWGFLALALMSGIGYGYKVVKDSGREEVRAEWAQANEAARQREAEASAKAAADLEAERKKRKIVVKEVTQYVDKIVDRPVYRNVCLDAAGLSCLESAIRGESTAGCKPDGTVPATSPAN